MFRHEIDVRQAAFPWFGFNLEREAAKAGGDLGDSRSFGKLVVAMAGTPQPVSPRAYEKVSDPFVEEALRSDDFDGEPALIEGSSDNKSMARNFSRYLLRIRGSL
ncbi:hypothetical protein PIB30_062046, partial [Stylosanthes scabra]|nr:hypothetical protein [Stylosanthes scabra]